MGLTIIVRPIFSAGEVTKGKMRRVAMMLKAIHAQESKQAAREKARQVAEELREIKRRTRAIGAFPDGNSALMLVCARLRYVAGSSWGEKRYMNMEHLLELDSSQSQTLVG